MRGHAQRIDVRGWYSVGRGNPMIPRPKPEKFRLRRTMMFMNAQKPGLLKDAYIYGSDSIILALRTCGGWGATRRVRRVG